MYGSIKLILDYGLLAVVPAVPLISIALAVLIGTEFMLSWLCYGDSLQTDMPLNLGLVD